MSCVGVWGAGSENATSESEGQPRRCVCHVHGECARRRQRRQQQQQLTGAAERWKGHTRALAHRRGDGAHG